MIFSKKNIYLIVLMSLIAWNIGCEFKKTATNTTIEQETAPLENEVELNEKPSAQQIKQTLFNEITAKVKNRNYDQAIVRLDKFITKYPDESDAYNTRGACYMCQGPINDSEGLRLGIKDFNEAIKINNKNPKYYNNRGWAYQFQDKYPEALSSFETARKLDSTNVGFHGNILRVKFITNQNKEALKLCDSIIQKFPNDGYAYHVRGDLKRDYLHKYLEGNKDKEKAKEIGWNQGVNLLF